MTWARHSGGAHHGNLAVVMLEGCVATDKGVRTLMGLAPHQMPFKADLLSTDNIGRAALRDFTSARGGIAF
jgi:hypothetical protein